MNKHFVNCKAHGETPAYAQGNKRHCKKCNVIYVTTRRKELKKLIVEERGGCCELCGYNKCLGALEFHHRNPLEKEFSLGTRGLTRSLDKIRIEASKCDLICANCHREKHYDTD